MSIEVIVFRFTIEDISELSDSDKLILNELKGEFSFQKIPLLFRLSPKAMEWVMTRIYNSGFHNGKTAGTTEDDPSFEDIPI